MRGHGVHYKLRCSECKKWVRLIRTGRREYRIVHQANGCTEVGTTFLDWRTGKKYWPDMPIERGEVNA